MTITTIVSYYFFPKVFYHSQRWFMDQQGKDLGYTSSTGLIVPSHNSDTLVACELSMKIRGAVGEGFVLYFH